jgi:hypothetical protein
MMRVFYYYPVIAHRGTQLRNLHMKNKTQSISDIIDFDTRLDQSTMMEVTFSSRTDVVMTVEVATRNEITAAIREAYGN